MVKRFMLSETQIQQPPLANVRSVTRPRFTEQLKIWLVLLLALVQGLIHFFLLPPWQHYDEPTHFEYAWLIANRRELPNLDAVDHQMRREVVTSMIEHDFFWNLTPPDLLTDDKQIWIGISELVHPPTYYIFVSLPLYLTRHLDMTTQLYVARFASLLMFLLVTLIAIGLMRDLVPRDHALRWLIPLTVVLLPPFASHMTSVNNDVGAVLVFSLFLWGIICLIRYGISLWRLLWVISSAAVAFLTKNTAAVALVMLPLAFLVALWVQFRWSWRWFWLGSIGLGLLLLIAVVDVGDAAYWYRNEWGAPQVTANRSPSLLAPNEYAISVEVSSADPNRNLLNPLLPEDVERIKGQTVTVGGWLWADEPVEILAPGLFISAEGTNRLSRLYQSIEVTSTPTFFAHSYQIPDNTEVAYYAFWANNLEERSEPFQLYLDDAFLITGELSAEALASVEANSLPSAIQENNLIRNPSGEQMWLRLRPWAHRIVGKTLRRSPSYVFSALEDLPKNGPFLLGLIAPWLLNDFFSAFAWGHVRLGVEWVPLFQLLIALALIGSVKWLIQTGVRQHTLLWPAVLFLAFVAFVVWASALLWPLPYQWAKIQFPSGRYLYVSIIPSALLLAGGWWALWPRAYRRLGVWGWVLLLLLLNVLSINTIRSFYLSLAVPQ